MNHITPSQYQLEIASSIQKAPSDIQRFGVLCIKEGKRPTGCEPIVLEHAAKSVLQSVMAWLNEPRNEVNESEVLADLMMVANCEDGYQAASTLERRRCWTPDSELTEILDMLPVFRDEATNELIAIWVREFDVKTSLSIGDEVKFTTIHNGVFVEATGTVEAIEPQRAVCVVRSPELGHVERGKSGRMGVILPYESLEPVNAHILENMRMS